MATVDVFACLGQSNAQGRGSSSTAPTTDPALVWEWGGAANGIIAFSEPGPPHVGIGVKSNTASAWGAFANEFTTYSERPAMMVRRAVSASSLLSDNEDGPNVFGPRGSWAPDATGDRYGDAITDITDALAELGTAGHTLGELHVLWHQGEQDAIVGNNLSAFQAALEALPGRFRISLSVATVNVYYAAIGRRTEDSELVWAEVRDYQLNATADGLILSYTNCVNFPDLGWMNGDGIHYSQPGLTHMGSTMGAFVAEDLGFAIDPGPPPAIQSATSLAGRHLTYA